MDGGGERDQHDSWLEGRSAPDEPRSATLYCQRRTGAWACDRASLSHHLRLLPPPVRRQIDATFEANMSKIYQVRAHQLSPGAAPSFGGGPSSTS